VSILVKEPADIKAYEG